MPEVKETSINTTIWLPHTFACSIAAESEDSTKPKKGYVWKKDEVVVATTDTPSFALKTVKESDKTGWSVNVRGYAQDDNDFAGDSVDIGTENFTFELFDNQYVEYVYPPTSFVVGDEIKAKIVFRIHIPENISVDLYYNDGLVDTIDGDLGLDHREFKIAKFAWPEFSGTYRMELSDDTGDVKFVYPFEATIHESAEIFNAQKYSPVYFTVTDDSPANDEYTVVRYRLEREDGSLIYESTDRTLFVTKHAQETDAGVYVALVRAYKAASETREGTAYILMVIVIDSR